MIKVAVVDSEKLLREGVCSVLRASGRIDVVAEASDGRNALELARNHRPDVMVMEVRVHGVDGIRVTEAVRRELPDTKVIILTASTHEECVYRSFLAGANGYLVKDASPYELVNAVVRVVSGQSILAPAMTRSVIDKFLRFDRDRVRRARCKVESLTGREREVLSHVVKGDSNAEIARALYVSQGAVKAHMSHILDKLPCTNRVQAAIVAHESGLFAA